jgi:hypothetical protein
MEKKLYKVVFINQETGYPTKNYVLATGMAQIESEYADIELCEPLTPFEDLTEELIK